MVDGCPRPVGQQAHIFSGLRRTFTERLQPLVYEEAFNLREPMSGALSVINELETALQSGSMAKRTEFLRRVTDLFLGGVDSFSSEQVSLLDDVMSRLVTDIEGRVLAELTPRLASLTKAPANVIQRLARDDDIAVSGPLLQQSEQLSDEDLAEIANTKSQDHLLKISGRTRLKETVTDILVDRGNPDVAKEVAGNMGASFSPCGISKLAIRAEEDDGLTTRVAGRPDLPPLLLRHVLARATDVAREKLLLSAEPGARDVIRKVLTEVSRRMSGTLTPQQYAQAQRLVGAISQDTALTKTKLWEFATTRRFAETVVALSVLSAVPIDLVDHLVNNPSPFGTIVLCRAVALEWPTTQVVMCARPGADEEPRSAVDALREEYHQLSTPSAQRLLRFWQARQDQTGIAGRKTASAVAAAGAMR